MLVIQVAIGIVLGLIIFAYLPQTLVFGFIFLAIAIALVVIGLLLFTEIGQGVVAGLAVMLGVAWLATQLSNRSGDSELAAEASPNSGSTVDDSEAGSSASIQTADDANYHQRNARISGAIVAGLLILTILIMTLVARYG